MSVCVETSEKMNVFGGGGGLLDLFQEPAQVIML